MKKRKDSCLSILLLFAFLLCAIAIHSINCFRAEDHLDDFADISLYAAPDEDDSFEAVKDPDPPVKCANNFHSVIVPGSSGNFYSILQHQLKVKERALFLTCRCLRI